MLSRPRSDAAYPRLGSNPGTSSRVVHSDLKEWRPYQRLILERNPEYYDAHLVSLDEVHFFTVSQASTIVDLYEADEVHSMPGERIPSQFLPLLEGRRDFCQCPAVFGVWWNINTHRPPFDDPLVRYAVSMAIDKQQMTRVVGAGWMPARGFGHD